MKQARLAAEKAARRGGEGGEDSAGGDQDDAAPARQKLGMSLRQALRMTRYEGICCGGGLVCCQVESGKQPCNE